MSLSQIPVNELEVSQGIAATGEPFALLSLTGGYMQNFYTVLSAINKKKGVWTNVQTEKHWFGVVNNEYPNQRVKSVTVVGNTVIVKFIQPDYTAFRVNDVVSNQVNTSLKGIVTDASVQGQVTLQGIEGATVADLASLFSVGNLIMTYYDNEPISFSGPKDTLTYTPDKRYNLMSVGREDMTWSSRQYPNTKFLTKTNDGAYRMFQQEYRMRKAIEQINLMFLFSTRGETTINNTTRQSNGGLKWAIQNWGGNYQGLTSILTRPVFENWVQETYYRNTSSRAIPPILICGYLAFKRISSFYENWLINSGQNNAVKEINGELMVNTNIYRLSFGGIPEIYIMQDDSLNNPDFNKAVSAIPGVGLINPNIIFMLDVNDVPNDMTGGMEAGCEMLAWNGNPFTLSYVPGMRDGNAFKNLTNAEIKAQGASVVSTAIDGASYSFLWDCGVNLRTAKFCGMLEYAY